MSDDPTTRNEPAKATPSVGFWVGVVVGWAIIVFAVHGLLGDARAVPRDRYARVLFGGLLVHDLLVVPTVLVVGTLLARAVPARWRSTVTAGMIISAVVVAFSVPFVGGYGRVADNATILPRDYGRGLVVVLVNVWLVTIAVTAAVARLRRARQQ